MQPCTATGPLAVIERIQQATSAHDLDALGECFDINYQSEQPMRPDRAFRGREQMRKNWSQIFAAVPDIQADVLRTAVDGNVVWAEWSMHGTGSNGVPSHTAMVTIAGIEHEQVVWMRLFMDQVRTGEDIDTAVRTSLSGIGASG